MIHCRLFTIISYYLPTYIKSLTQASNSQPEMGIGRYLILMMSMLGLCIQFVGPTIFIGL